MALAKQDRAKLQAMCQLGCYGMKPPEIAKLSDRDAILTFDKLLLDLTTGAVQALTLYRGGGSLQARPIDMKIDPKTGLVKPGYGVSLNADPSGLGRFGGAYEIDPSSVPPELEIIQRGIPILITSK